MPVALEVGNLVSSGSITWEVLAVKDSKALLLSKDIIARMPYYVGYEDGRRGYASSAIRDWLNWHFFYSLPHEFSQRVIPTRIETAESIEGFNPEEYGLAKDESVNDKVFLLSAAEAKALFSNEWKRRSCLNLDYLRGASARLFAARSEEDRVYAESCNSWWLRTSSSDGCAEVSASGAISRVQESVAISSYELDDLDTRFGTDDVPMQFLGLLGFKLGSTKLNASLPFALMGSRRGFPGVRPALWFDFSDRG